MKLRHRFILLAAASVLVSCGPNTKTTIHGSNVDTSKTQPTSNKSSLTGRAFSVDEDIHLDSYKNTESGEEIPVALTMAAGATVSVVDEQVDKSGRRWLRLAVEYSESNVMSPSDVWVEAKSFQKFQLSEVTADEDLMSEGDSIAADFERMTYCFRFVKKYLMKIGLVKTYLPGSSAYMAAGILPKYGFKRTGRSPAQARLNDVCVYRGGAGGNGHIEIKTARGWYYGYGYISHPIANHPFIACFHK